MSARTQHDMEKKYHAEYHRSITQHTWQYWISLGSKDYWIPSIKPPLNRTGCTLVGNDDWVPELNAGIHESSAYAGWTPEMHYASAMANSNPRAKERSGLRDNWALLHRHHYLWTQDELLKVHGPRFLRQVGKANQGPVTYGFWVELGWENGRPHIHMLLGGIGKLSVEKLKRIWVAMNGGRPVVRPYSAWRNKNGYAYKYIGGNQVDLLGRDRELLWAANYWKPDRAHNSPEQARLFDQTQMAS